MEPDPFDLGSPTIPVHPERSWWRGAKTGLRRVAYVAGPIAGLATVLSLALMALGVGSGRGWALSIYLPITLGGLLGFELIGGLLGSILGRIRGRRQPVRSKPRPWWNPAGVSKAEAGGDPIEGDPRPNPGPFWPWLLGALAFLTVLTAYGTGYLLGRSVDRHLAAASSEADKDDPAWRVDDLMAARPAVPEAENSAVLVNRAFGLLPRFWPDPPIPADGQPELPPILGEALERLERTPESVQLDQATADELRRELVKQAEAVRIARTVAGLKRGRYKLVLGATLLDTPMRHLADARVIARLLAADAAIRLHDGDPDGALESCRASFGVARSIGDEPFLVSQIVRIRIGETALAAALRVLGQGEPSDQALAGLQTLVLEELTHPFLLQGVRGERAMAPEIIRRIADGEMPVAALSGAPASRPGDPREPFGGWARLVMDHQRALMLEWMNRMVAIARRPVAEQPALVAAWRVEVERVRQTRFSEKSATLPLLFAAASPALASADFRYRARLGALAILLAAERHRQKLGEWPKSIAAISPTILAAAPLDPFTGQPFRMEHGDGKLIVYSIGPNHQDEHGATTPDRSAQAGPDDPSVSARDAPLRRQPPEPVE